MKRLLLLFAVVALSAAVNAQKLDVGLTAGTTGLGVEFGAKLCEPLRVRVGISYFPRITVNKSYGMSSVSDVKTEESQEKRIERLCRKIGEFINSDHVDPYLDMEHCVNFWNAKVLFDAYPFHNKNWHVTAGVYMGPKKMGEAVNLRNEAPTVMGIVMYNGVYDKLKSDLAAYRAEFPDDPDYIPSVSFMDMQFSPLPEQWEEMQKVGRIVVPMGQFADGRNYYLEPTEDGVMYSDIIAHIVKPYIGVGYNISFGQDKRWNFGADVGALIFGESPHVYDNQGVCLTHDVSEIGGEVGKLVNLVNKMPVYPNLEVRLSYTIR